MITRAVLAMSLTLVLLQPAAAREPLLHESSIYIGGGISSNDAHRTDSAIGAQIFVGYDLPVKIPHSTLSVEVGYWDSGDMEHDVTGRDVSADGIWATGVFAFHVSESIDLLGRAGFDFGDDDGFMLGIGLGVGVGRSSQLRFEFVERDETDSIQVNFVYHF